MFGLDGFKDLFFEAFESFRALWFVGFGVCVRGDMFRFRVLRWFVFCLLLFQFVELCHWVV